MTDSAAKEALLSAYDAAGYAERRVEAGDLSAEAVRAMIRSQNVLCDAALDCGMSQEEPDVMAWAVKRVTSFLCEA